MQDDATNAAIAKFTQEIARRIPEGQGFITIERWRDEEWIRGDDIGLLTLGVSILVRVAQGENAYRFYQPKLDQMVPGGFLTCVGVLPIENEREKKRLSRQEKPGWWTCGLLIAAFLIFVTLAMFGLYHVARWFI